MPAARYAYRLAYQPSDGRYLGMVDEMPSVASRSRDPVEALLGARAEAACLAAELRACGRPVPEPLCDRVFSGRFALRMSPEQHRLVAEEALRRNVSINQLLCARIG